MKRIVIDGATSMLGLALINECIARETEVIAIARTSSKRLNILPDSDYVRIVKAEQNELKHLEISDVDSCDAYYHFAWSNTYSEERKDVFLQEPNIQYTLDAIKLAERLGCKKFIGAGSQAEYGRVSGIIGPNTPINPDVAYGVAKYAASKMSQILCDEIGVECIWTRTFSVYGIGDNVTTLVMYAIDNLLKGQKPSFTKAEQRWDYLYSKDAGRAFYLIGQRGKNRKIYCIGSGESRPLKEYITTIRDTIDKTLPIGIGERPYAPLQVMNLQADISELTEDTGFLPEYSFEQGIKETIEWYRKLQS